MSQPAKQPRVRPNIAPTAIPTPLTSGLDVSPATNSTVSAPSRNTDKATATATAHRLRWPSAANVPKRLASWAIWNALGDTQMQCQASMASAVPKIATWTISCPTPSAQALISPMADAINKEPKPPTATPSVSHRLRCSNPRVAAAMMPMKSAASSVSRNTIRPVANMVNPYSTTSTPVAVPGLNSPKNG